MATFAITAPTGEQYEITAPDNASQADILSFAQQNHVADSPVNIGGQTPDLAGAISSLIPTNQTMQAPADSNKVVAGIINQMKPMGIGDELSAGFAAPAEYAGNVIGRNINPNAQSKSLSDFYNRDLQNERNTIDLAQKEAPTASILSNIGGALATGGLGAESSGATALSNSLRSGNLAARTLKGAALGAATTGAYGFASGEGGAGNRIQSAEDNAPYGLVLGAAAPLAGAAVKGIGNALAPKVIQTSDDLKQVANQLYNSAAEKGGVLTPQFTDSFIDKVSQIAPQSDLAKTIGGKTPIAGLIDDLQSYRGKPIDLNSAQEFDELLGDLVDGEFNVKGLTKQGKKILDVQSTFRDMINNAGEGDIAGGKEGFDALKEARATWAKSSRMRDVERIITRAEQTDNPSTAIKTGFRTLYNSPTRIRGYTTQEKALIKNAAESSMGVDALRTLGSRLVGIIGGATHGAPGAIAGQIVSTASRGAATKLQVGKATKILQEIQAPKQQAPRLADQGKQFLNTVKNIKVRVQ